MANWYAQPGFVSGEMAPSLYGRTDLARYKQGASVMRNAFVNYKGGILSRPGSKFVGMCKQAAPNAGGTPTSFAPRDIKFQFNINQGFDLEFGDQYMRVVSDGAYVTEASKNISAISQSNPSLITITAHGYNDNDWIFIDGTGTPLDSLTWIVQNAAANTFNLTDLFSDVVNSTNYPSYVSGGTSARIYTAISPYAAVDLPYLKFTQSSNTMSLTCWNQVTFTEYPPYELLRVADNNWTFTQETFSSPIEAPIGITVTPTSSTTTDTWYSYVVTAVDSAGNESVASASADIQNNDISINAGSNIIDWQTVPNATSYNVYAAVPVYQTGADPGFIGASYGYIGSAFGTSFTDTNITADFTTTPPIHNDPFAPGAILQVLPTSGGSGLSQATLEYEINTTTGTGFDGDPIVNSNGNFVGFLIYNSGQDYAQTDTITLITGGVAATGTYTFTSNPSNGQTIILNGITWTFVTTPTTKMQTKIGISVAATLAQLVSDLFTSGNSSITSASYTLSTDVLDITYNELGIVGNSYTLASGTYGGAVSAATLTGGTNGTPTGATAALTIGPLTGQQPGLVAYYQQRRTYGSTQNNPDTYFMSQSGAYQNFDASIPAVDSDSIIGTPWAQQVNGIQAFLVSPTGLLAFCGNGAWLINGGAATAITPADQSAQSQAYNGISPFVPPIAINYHILYVQSKGSIIRDLAFNIFVNVYTGEDITLISNHLFFGFTIPQMAYAEEPFKVVWAVRNDGVMLSLTYLAEQDIKAFARHDTNGLYVGVCTVTEPPVDAVYLVVQRYVNGIWLYYKERFDNRSWVLAEDCFCVDAGLSYPMNFPDATLMPAAANGTNNITSANVVEGGGNYTNPIVEAVDSTGSGSGAIFLASLENDTGVITLADSAGTNPVLSPDGTKLYIGYYDGANGAVAIISTSTNAIIHIIATGNGAALEAIAITPDGSKLYIPDENANVLCIDTASSSVTTITSGTFNQPIGIGITPDGTKAYVVNAGSNSLSVISIPANTVSATTINLGIEPLQNIVITPDGTKAYVPGQNGSTSFGEVACVTLSDNSIILISCGGFSSLPDFSAITPDGTKIYVPLAGTNSVAVLSVLTNQVAQIIAAGSSPNAAFINSAGTLVYVTNGGDNTITIIGVITGATNLITSAFTNLPSDPIISGSTLYASNESNPNIVTIGLDSLSIVAVTPTNGGNNYTPGETDIVVTDSTGSGAIVYPIITNYVTFTASSGVFDGTILGVPGQVIRVGNGQAVVVTNVSATQVAANVTIPITAVVNNDPSFTPIPAVSGTWSITTPTTTVSGLNHLIGLTVTGLADGGVIAPQMVGVLPNGAIGITLPSAASAINVGLPFIVQLQTLQLDFPDQAGSSQGRRKNISGVNVRFEQSRGIQVGTNQIVAATLPGMVNPTWIDMIDVKESNPDVPLGQSIPLVTGDYFLPVYNDWATEGRVAVQQLLPLPCNITAIFPKFEVGDK